MKVLGSVLFINLIVLHERAFYEREPRDLIRTDFKHCKERIKPAAIKRNLIAEGHPSSVCLDVFRDSAGLPPTQ
jgi:hypothetical protein